jgi:chromosome segregation ATPase
MAESTSKSLSDLVRALASATGWVQHVVELNTALQPFLANGLDLDSIEADIESARQRHAGIAVQIRAAEDQLASVNERITLADDARRLQIDADLNAYAASVDSRKRALDTELAALRDKLSVIVESITTKSEVAVALDAQIADQRRTLDQLKSDAAGVVSKLTAIAGGASN